MRLRDQRISVRLRQPPDVGAQVERQSKSALGPRANTHRVTAPKEILQRCRARSTSPAHRLRNQSVDADDAIAIFWLWPLRPPATIAVAV